jgi:hypothetical protein
MKSYLSIVPMKTLHLFLYTGIAVFWQNEEQQFLHLWSRMFNFSTEDSWKSLQDRIVAAIIESRTLLLMKTKFG